MTEAAQKSQNILDACDLIDEARDYVHIVALACEALQVAEAAGIIRVAHLAMDTLHRAEEKLEQSPPTPCIIRKEMA